MPKLENGGKGRSVALSQIVESGNIRTHYTDIVELAESIKAHGLIEPVAVKALGKNADGIEEYELVAGFRRRAAVQLLYDRKDGPGSIDAVVVTGDTLTIQLVENLQRNDLAAKERERGIYLMAQSGLQIREIAARLSKSESFISRNITAYKIRGLVEETGLDTSDVSTQALNEIQAAEQKDLGRIVRALIQQGGTVSVARQLMKQYNAKNESGGLPLDVPPSPFPGAPHEAREEPPAENTSTQTSGEYEGDLDPLGGEVAGEPPQVGNGAAEPPAPKKAPPKKKSGQRPPIIPFDPPHKMVDANSVQLIIEEYRDLVETRANEGFAYKVDAAHDIWALLLDRL